MKFVLEVEDVEEFDKPDAESIAKELQIVLENEGYTVYVSTTIN